ncbi:MAG TPA: FAD-dependent oxidoreductase, partial [Opitutaceae bacterium]
MPNPFLDSVAGSNPSLSPDIVVVGGGFAGVMAALAAKTPRNRVLLIEPSNVLGGQGTAGGVAGFCGDTARVNDEFAAIVAKLAANGLIEPYRPNDDRRAYDLEWCAFFLQETVVARGIDVLLLSRVVAAEVSEGRIGRITVSTSSGLIMLTPKFAIDASGACVLPALTGFPFMHEGANRQLPMSLYFTLWDTGRPVAPVLPEGCPRWAHDDEIPMTSLHRFPSGKVEVKMKVVGFDAADGFSRSAAEIFARRQMHGLIYYLQTVGYRGKKLDTHVLASVSRGIGVREERRIVGEHVLSEAEARRAVIFEDAVAVNTYHIDFHWPDRMQRAGTGITDMLDPHHLPLRMMIPRGAKNLLVAGRGASGDQTAMSAYRVMAVVSQLGFAAGHAARQCVETGSDLATLDIAKLQAAIEAGGQSLNLSDYGDYLRCDLLAEEVVPGVTLAAGATLALRQERNACFILSWSDGSEEWRSERREKRWSAPQRAGQGASFIAGAARVTLVDGALVEVAVVDGNLRARLSHNGGVTWTAPREL